jgi:hypothetical protein
MNTHPTSDDTETIAAPWGKQVTLQPGTYEGGMPFIRLRIKEGSRFTDLELDHDTASRIGRSLAAWVDKHPQEPPSGT